MQGEHRFVLTVFGDIVGRPGRTAVKKLLPTLIDKFQSDLVIANGENMAGGVGFTRDNVDEIFAAGVDFMTGGNHSFRKKDGHQVLEENSRVIRPANFPPGVPGRGFALVEKDDLKIAVLNLQGRVFMEPIDCPFRTVDQILEDPRVASADYRVVDFHGEATSEKIAMGYYLDGRVDLVYGTHTHIPTADNRILPAGTAYITDIGMCGPRDSAIGVELRIILKKMIYNLPERFEVSKKGPVVLQGINVILDRTMKKAIKIERFDELVD